jgi:hypothetical protein
MTPAHTILDQRLKKVMVLNKECCMNDRITLRVTDLIGSPLCISAEDGQKVFDKLSPLLKEGKQVDVSFERVTTLISLFLNAAIGQLYGIFTEDQIRSQVKIVGLPEDDLDMLKRVEVNAKKYYANPKEYDQALKFESNDEE